MMPVAITVPSPLRSYTGGASKASATGATIDELLADLDRQFPGIRFRMVDEHARIRPHIRIFAGAREIQTLSEPAPGAEPLHLVCALSGG